MALQQHRWLPTLLATTALCGVAQAQETATPSTLALPTVNVRAERPVAEQPFATPAPVSTVTPEQIEQAGGNAKRLLEMTPGVAIDNVASQPGIEVNIRGMEGFGRVHTMIDGVRQTFRVAGHEGGSFAYIDPFFLSGIDVERGAITTAGGMGALAGAVNFRTLEADDIIRPGNSVGARSTVMAGNNGYNFSGGVVGAARAGNGVSILAGISGLNQSRYDNGRGEEVENSWQNMRNGMIKLGFEPSPEHRLSLGGRVYTNRFSSNYYDQRMQVNTLTAGYNYNPGSQWVDLRVNASYNASRMNWYDRNNGSGWGTSSGRLLVDTAYGIDVTNTSRFALGPLDVRWDYGAQYAQNDVETRAGGVNPDGTMKIGGAFSQMTFTRGIVDFIAGIRYDHYQMDGEGYAAPTNAPVPVTGVFQADGEEGRASPKFTLAVRPTEWLQLYTSYGWSFRPPTTAEALYSGVHAGATSSFYPNPNLEAEHGQGVEVGFNILAHDVLRSGDSLRLKAGYFRTRVEDFINLVSVVDSAGRSKSFYENVAGTSTLSGVEVEGGYDIGVAYANLTFTHTDIDYADAAARNFLPDTMFGLDVGTRLLDRSVTLGTRLRTYGRTQGRASATAEPTGGYTLFDLYGSWAVNDNVRIFANATNLFDVTYTQALSETPDTGRGRTIVGGLTVSF